MREHVRRASCVLGLLHCAASVASAQPICPDTGSLTVFVENLSAAAALDVAVDGELAPDAVTCVGNGATSYRQTMMCAGPGVVRCGQVTGLRPGAWSHRLAVTVPGSAPQQQAQRLVLVAGPPTDVSNALVWTIYPQTFIVGSPSADELQRKLDQAAAYTLCNAGPALITFSADAFPGAHDPRRIDIFTAPCIVAARNRCSATIMPDRCPCELGDAADSCRLGGVLDGTTAGVCLAADRIVVDALDHDALPGGVILSVGACGREVLRLYGSDDVLRGLVFEGSAKPNPTKPSCQVDTLAITGARARRNRIEESLVIGPTCGDTVSVDHGAGQPDGEGPGDNLVVESRITGGDDKGVKVDFGAVVTIERSCVHDNRNGGVQSTLGGHVAAIENVVQHNVPGAAQNGLSVRGSADRSTLATEGNVVRFSGGRGLSVTDNAEAVFADDYVAESQFAGSRVETTASGPDGAVPAARFRGVALVCNRQAGETGTCSPSPSDGQLPCTTVEDCCTNADGSVDAACVATTQCTSGPGSFPDGFGAVTAEAAGHAAPDVDYGTAREPGGNAFTSNQNTAAGANFRVTDVNGLVPAAGNQWEHCAAGPPCDVAQDLSPPDAAVGFEPIADPRATLGFGLTRVSPARPRAGDVVRVYGRGFDAIGGNPVAGGTCANLPVCSPDGRCPTGPCVNGACPCSIANPIVEMRNAETDANRIRLVGADGAALEDANGTADRYPDAVTPTMLAFRMPVDCFAPLMLEVSKRGRSGETVSASISLCDPRGCADQPAGAPCDDGNACTVDDRCDGTGSCVGGAPRVCDGACLACDPSAGCEPVAAGTLCRPAAGPCDVPEICDGMSGSCPPDRFKPATATCDDGNACTVGDHCSGDGAVCIGDPVACDGPCLTGVCDPQSGCVSKDGIRAVTCRVDECARPTLHRRLRRLAVLIDQALDAGENPRPRRMRRLAALLARCGIR